MSDYTTAPTESGLMHPVEVRAVIVDDERLARNELCRLLARYPEIEVAGDAADVEEARGVLDALRPDLLFLDIQMPGEGGFDLLSSLDSVPLVVFTTAHDEHALRAFEFSALDYLLKPIDPGRLAKTVARTLAVSGHMRGRATKPAASEWRSGSGATVAGRVRRLIEAELADGDPSVEHVAERLHMSARTLHRRLADESTTFRRVLADVRRELAEHYLCDRDLAIDEVGYLLGFSEASAFHRAFKRWTGWPPYAYRRHRARGVGARR